MIGIHFTIAILILFEPWTAAIDIPYEDLNHPNKFCGPLSSCAGVDQKLAEAEAETGKHITEKRSCQCDDQCVEYGDCCADANRFEEQRNAAARYDCVATDTGDGAYAVARCPASWTDTRVRDACLEVAVDKDGMVSNPVTSRTTRHTYRNRFCATCNGDAADLILWDTLIVCADLIDVAPEHEQSVRQTIHYNATSGGQWTVSYSGVEYECSPVVVRPAMAPTRPCLPDTVVTCHPQWPADNIRSNCEGYTTIMYENFERPYKNIHCAMCNHVPVQNLTCKQSELLFRFHSQFAGRSFSALFIAELDRRKCSDSNSYYDPLVKKCLSLNGDHHGDRDDNPVANVVLTYVGLGVSAVLLVVHLAVFAVLPEMKNLSGKNLASFCVSLVWSYVAFIIGNWLSPGSACYVGAAVTYYAFLASFAWMLTMSFDCWRSLRLATVELRVTDGRQTRKFLVYSAVCWIVPAMATMAAVAADAMPVVPEYFRPRFGDGQCWFGSKTALLLFFAGPLTAVMVTNVVLFGWTAYMIHSSRATVRHVNTRHVRRDFRMYCRLAVLMGLTWTTGLVASYTGANYYMWTLFVALNTFQGLFVFVAFTCRRRVLKSLVSWFGCTDGRLSNVMSRKNPKAGVGDKHSVGPMSSYTWSSSENGVPVSSDEKTTDTLY